MKTSTIQHIEGIPLRSGRKLDLSRILVMGILNVTPDSFSDGGKFSNMEDAIGQAIRMTDEGADIIDIGGESARPGSVPVSAETEKERVIPVIKEIRKMSDIPISIDTAKADVAAEAIEAGADIINDISALRFDEKMIEIAAKYDVPVILMHMLGEPKSMQANPHYQDCLNEIRQFFKERIRFCTENGVDMRKIIIDPGIGFGKRLQDNLDILKNLSVFSELGCPLMLGASRKSFISMITGNKGPADKRIGGSLAALYYAVRGGCWIVRVHDVAESIEAINVIYAVEGGA